MYVSARKAIIDERLMPVFSLLMPVKDLLKKNRNWLIMAAAIFAAGFFFAYLSPLFQGNSLPGLEGQFEELEQLFKVFLDNPPLITALLVFMNNFVAMVQMLFLGVFAGLSPLATLFLNGYMLGAVAAVFKAEGGPVLQMLVSGILPHGLFELFALFLCGALGLKLGYHCIAAPLPGMNRRQSFKHIWKEIVSLIPLIVTLLLAAALIEIFVTAHLVARLG